MLTSSSSPGHKPQQVMASPSAFESVSSWVGSAHFSSGGQLCEYILGSGFRTWRTLPSLSVLSFLLLYSKCFGRFLLKEVKCAGTSYWRPEINTLLQPLTHIDLCKNRHSMPFCACLPPSCSFLVDFENETQPVLPKGQTYGYMAVYDGTFPNTASNGEIAPLFELLLRLFRTYSAWIQLSAQNRSWRSDENISCVLISDKTTLPSLSARPFVLAECLPDQTTFVWYVFDM